jgi:adenylosuccinate synthase
MVIDPVVLIREIDALKARGYLKDDKWLRVAEQAHVILPYHRAIDHARERMREAGAIGTTGRGIGPAYEDKMARTGIRFGDLFDEDGFKEALARSLREKNQYLEALLGEKPHDAADILELARGWRERLRPYVTDAGAEVRAAIAAGKRVLLEGAQGMFLDIDHGTYPYVTSSNCVVGSASAGAGIPPRAIGRVIGITKPTRPGSAAARSRPSCSTPSGSDCAPTATSTAPRRAGRAAADGSTRSSCGRRSRSRGSTASRSRSSTCLTGMNPIRVCVAYEIDGKRHELPPATQLGLDAREARLRELPGWTEPLGRARSLDDLPANARRYLDYVVKAVGAPMAILSIGAGREQTIRLRDVF